MLPWQIFQQLRMGILHEKCDDVKFCFKLGKIFSETFKMLKQAFWEEARSRTWNREFYKYKLGQWMFRMTFNIKKWRKHSKSLESDLFQSSFDHSWIRRGIWNFKNHVSLDSHWKCRHTLCYSNICATHAVFMSVKSLSTVQILNLIFSIPLCLNKLKIYSRQHNNCMLLIATVLRCRIKLDLEMVCATETCSPI